MTYRVITPPASDPITSALVKEHLRVIGTDEDLKINNSIKAAALTFEQYTGQALVNQTIKQTIDQFPCGKSFFLLEKGAHATTLVSLQYYNKDNVLTTVPSDVYFLVDASYPASINLNTNKSWPIDIHPTRIAAVEITYTTGYGANETAVPADIKEALSLIIGDMYLHREDTIMMPGVAVVNPTHNSKKIMNQYVVNYWQHREEIRQWQ